MSQQPQNLKPRTKAFALRVIRMYSKLPKNDTVAQALGKQVLVPEQVIEWMKNKLRNTIERNEARRREQTGGNLQSRHESRHDVAIRCLWVAKTGIPTKIPTNCRDSMGVHAQKPKSREILNDLLEKYATNGELQFTLPNVLKVPPISQHGNVAEIIGIFGGADQLRNAVNQLQSLVDAA